MMIAMCGGEGRKVVNESPTKRMVRMRHNWSRCIEKIRKRVRQGVNLIKIELHIQIVDA